MGAALPKPFAWVGGKGNMLAKLLPLVPYGPDVGVYVEPYCGGAALFFAKRPHPVEVLNDLDGRVIALLRALQGREDFVHLRHRLLFTPYARAEYARATGVLNGGGDAGDVPWALFVVANQGMSGLVYRRSPGSWARSFLSDGGVSTQTNKWLMRLSYLDAWHRRLSGVRIECRDALEVIREWDSPRTFLYLDPPYVLEARRGRRVYELEVDLEHHRALVSLLLRLRGLAVLSGYAHPVYRPLEEAGWERRDWETASYVAARTRASGLRGGGKALARVGRVESVWLSPRLRERLGGDRGEVTLCAV